MSEQALILVVDDESHILHVVSMKLRNAGYEVVTAEDGEEGLAMAIEHRPDLVITDYEMPFLTGLELCERMKQEPLTCDVPAVMLTARGSGLAADVLARTNIAAVLSKPFSPREILERVQALIDPEQSSMEALKAS